MSRAADYCNVLFESKVTKEEAKSLTTSILGSLNQSIGQPKDLSTGFEIEIKALDKELLLQKSLKDYKRVKEIKKRRKVMVGRLKSEKLRLRLHYKIYNDLAKHAADVMAKTLFVMPNHQIIDAVNVMSYNYLGFPLMNLNHLNVPLIKKYSQMVDRFVRVKPKKKLGNWNEYSRDIFRMVATQEETGAGVLILDKITSLNESIFDMQQPFVDAYGEINGFFTKRVLSTLRNYKNLEDIRFRTMHKERYDYPIVEEVIGEQVTERISKELVVDKHFDDLTREKQEDLIRDDYIRLLSDLADGRVRYIVPTLYQNLTEEEKDFLTTYRKEYTTEFGEAYQGPSHHEMIINQQEKNGVESVWVMMKRNEDGSEPNNQHEYYAAVMIRRGGIDPQTGEYMWVPTIGAQMDGMWEGTGMREGFHEATQHTQYDYTIGDSNKNVDSYSDFEYLERQPIDEIAGINNKTQNPGQYNIWQALQLKREQNAKFINMVEEEIEATNKILNEAKILAEKKMKQDAMEDYKEILEYIEDIGGMAANLATMRDGAIAGWDTFTKKVTQNYSPQVYTKDTYWDDVDEAIAQSGGMINALKGELQDSEEIINDFKQGVSTGEQLVTPQEYYFHMNRKARLESKIKSLEDMRDGMQDMKTLALDDPYNPKNIRKMKLATRSHFTKHRKTFTNPLNRRRDIDLDRDYTNRFVTAIQYSRLKAELLKAMIIIESPEMRRWLINQTKISLKDLSYDAGFLGFKYGFQESADRINAIRGRNGQTSPVTSRQVSKWASNHNNWVSGNVLNWLSSITNMTQMESLIEDWGFRDTLAVRGMMKDAEVLDAVEASGVDDLITAYTDYMAGGDESSTPWHTFMSARLNWSLLKMNKKDFINKNTGIDRWLMRLLPQKDQDNYEALRKQRAAFWLQMNHLKKILSKKENIDNIKENDIREAVATRKEILILKKRIKDLNQSLNSSQINQLASWMLTWQISESAKSLFTFSGVELFMRRRAAIQGMLLAEKLGQLDANKEGNKYKQAPSLIMARVNVKNTMFGMSREYFPKMFGGLFGVVGFQFKTYTFAQWVREYNIMEQFFSESGGFFHVPGWSSRLLTAGKRKVTRTLTGEKLGYGDLIASGNPKFDLSAERMFTFLAIRGGMSVLTVLSTFAPGISLANSILRRFLPMPMGNSVRGAQSVTISFILRTLMLGLLVAGQMTEDEEEQYVKDWQFFFLPVIVNVLLSLVKGEGWAGLRAYVPGANVMNDIYETIDEDY